MKKTFTHTDNQGLVHLLGSDEKSYVFEKATIIGVSVILLIVAFLTMISEEPTPNQRGYQSIPAATPTEALLVDAKHPQVLEFSDDVNVRFLNDIAPGMLTTNLAFSGESRIWKDIKFYPEYYRDHLNYTLYVTSLSSGEKAALPLQERYKIVRVKEPGLYKFQLIGKTKTGEILENSDQVLRIKR